MKWFSVSYFEATSDNKGKGVLLYGVEKNEKGDKEKLDILSDGDAGSSGNLCV